MVDRVAVSIQASHGTQNNSVKHPETVSLLCLLETVYVHFEWSPVPLKNDAHATSGNAWSRIKFSQTVLSNSPKLYFQFSNSPKLL